MLILLALLILGIVWVASALIDNDAASMESLYGTDDLCRPVPLMVAVVWDIATHSLFKRF